MEADELMTQGHGIGETIGDALTCTLRKKKFQAVGMTYRLIIKDVNDGQRPEVIKARLGSGELK